MKMIIDVSVIVARMETVLVFTDGGMAKQMIVSLPGSDTHQEKRRDHWQTREHLSDTIWMTESECPTEILLCEALGRDRMNSETRV